MHAAMIQYSCVIGRLLAGDNIIGYPSSRLLSTKSS